jgi:hypothetical protein
MTGSPRGGRARLVLAVLALLLAASAWVPLTVGRGEEAKAPSIIVAGNKGADRPRDDDLKLYDRAIERILHGENYYDFIVSEHRRADYPVRPGAAVRMPTLAYLDAAMGVDGDGSAPVAMTAAVALMISVIAAWWGGWGIWALILRSGGWGRRWCFWRVAGAQSLLFRAA